MYETKKHIRKLGQRIETHGFREGAKYDWKKSHPIARTGFGLLATIGIVASASIGSFAVYYTCRDNTPERIEQADYSTDQQPLNAITNKYRNLNNLLD
ncbi:hypothetical protein CMI46_03110 [Candidatus Pacearchaeota archaeon]|nr:hypothetical protein [Candidatus Pacearchaeota archaeon]|tara:strand:+ start:445 stop:738 length:294 start_codon:yes stop_codon:yes gene_type:complete